MVYTLANSLDVDLLHRLGAPVIMVVQVHFVVHSNVLVDLVAVVARRIF